MTLLRLRVTPRSPAAGPVNWRLAGPPGREWAVWAARLANETPGTTQTASAPQQWQLGGSGSVSGPDPAPPGPATARRSNSVGTGAATPRTPAEYESRRAAGADPAGPAAAAGSGGLSDSASRGGLGRRAGSLSPLGTDGT
jgi:hypothetical protein